LIIALDYDGTYTADASLWEAFVELAINRGHEVHLVTMRYKNEPVSVTPLITAIHYTDRKAKRPYMQERGYNVQVWIDDTPEFIITSAAPRSLADNAATGLWAPCFANDA
jgi:hypothetical protein